MKFHRLPLAGAHTIELELFRDDRGFFARYFCVQELAEQGLETRITQINNSFSLRKGTLRGLHYQLPPAAEVKIVRCVRGAVWDVIVDLRPDSPTFKRWHAVELSAENRMMMYVPRGFAHGFMTITDDAEALYLMSSSYRPEQERGLRWNDPTIGIEWPITPTEMSPKDSRWPNLNPDYHGLESLRGLP